MKRIIAMQSSTWWLPVTGGLLVVLFFTTVVLRWGPQPAVAPGVSINQGQPTAPVAIEELSIDGVRGEYRGWFEVPAGTVTVRVKASNEQDVKVVHWLASEQAPVVDATTLRQAPSATRQPDGTWTATWSMEVNQTAHAIAYALGPVNAEDQSDALNIRAVR